MIFRWHRRLNEFEGPNKVAHLYCRHRAVLGVLTFKALLRGGKVFQPMYWLQWCHLAYVSARSPRISFVFGWEVFQPMYWFRYLPVARPWLQWCSSAYISVRPPWTPLMFIGGKVFQPMYWFRYLLHDLGCSAFVLGYVSVRSPRNSFVLASQVASKNQSIPKHIWFWSKITAKQLRMLLMLFQWMHLSECNSGYGSLYLVKNRVTHYSLYLVSDYPNDPEDIQNTDALAFAKDMVQGVNTDINPMKPLK